MGLDSNVIDKIVNLTKPTCEKIDIGNGTVKYLISYGGGSGLKPEILEFEKIEPRCHRFNTLQSFCNYLKSDHCKKDVGIIFVGEEEIRCSLRYQQKEEDRISLPLKNSEEYKSLQDLFNWINQECLWKLLRSNLYNHIDNELLVATSRFNVELKASKEVKIDLESGIQSGTETGKIILSFPDSKGATKQDQVKFDWQFNGRIWECFDWEFKINLRLALKQDDKKGLMFIFYPQQLQKVLREARLAFVDHLSKEIPENFTIYEGEYIG